MRVHFLQSIYFIALLVCGTLATRTSWALFLFQNFLFLKKYKGLLDHKTHKLQFCQFQQFFWCFWCWRCFLVLFSSSVFFCASPFIESTQKMIQKITNRLRVVSRAPCLDECFFYIFFLSILKGVKAYFINILQYLMYFFDHIFSQT